MTCPVVHDIQERKDFAVCDTKAQWRGGLSIPHTKQEAIELLARYTSEQINEDSVLKYLKDNYA